MYQALYRKYRPLSFSDVAGQEHVTDTLRRQIMTGRLSHAYLFVGTRGTGKTTCAKILSRAVNCQNPVDGDPCNKCASCIGIENGSILDVLELDAASNNGVDNVRALRDDAIYTPATVKKRVYILDEVHMLSTSAANALLKILEEPPEHLIFILATTELHKVPATIMSRCQRFTFKRISPPAIIERLNTVAESEGFTLTPEASEKLASLADGSLRDGLSLLDQCATDMTIDMQRVLDTIGLTGMQDVLGIEKAAASGEISSALGILDAIYNNGRDMASLLSELASLIRDLLLFKLSADSPLISGGFPRAELSSLSKNLSPERLLSQLEIIREAVFNLSRGMSVRLTVEMCIIRICDERLSDDTSALVARIAKLEDARIYGVQDSAPGDERKYEVRDTILDDDGNSGIINPEPGIDADESQSVILPDDPQDSEEEMAAPVAENMHEASGDAGGSTDSPSESSADFWHNILEQLKGDMAVYSLLSDSERVNAQLCDGALIVGVGDLFTAGLIESKDYSDLLARAAQKALGSTVAIRVEISTGATGDTGGNKLDSLMKNFSSIVKQAEE